MEDLGIIIEYFIFIGRKISELMDCRLMKFIYGFSPLAILLELFITAWVFIRMYKFFLHYIFRRR